MKTPVPGTAYLSMNCQSGIPHMLLDNTVYCYCSWFPTRARWQELMAEDSTSLRYRTRRSPAGPEREYSPSIHYVGRSYSGYCEKSHQWSSYPAGDTSNYIPGNICPLVQLQYDCLGDNELLSD